MLQRLIGPVFLSVSCGVMLAVYWWVPACLVDPILLVTVIAWFYFFPKTIAISVGKSCDLVRYWTASFGKYKEVWGRVN